MTTHRLVTEQEKKEILSQPQHKKDGHVICYVNGHPILDEKDIDFHHIIPFVNIEETEISNIAPVCKEHHKKIGTLSITEFRGKLEMEEFFNSSPVRKLNEVIEYKGNKDFGTELKYTISENKETIDIFFDDKTRPSKVPLHTCPATNFQYFYLTVPVKYISNDDDLQPRPIDAKRLWAFYTHFITHTQLSPAVCRINENKILLFDGQHKSAAQIWAGRRIIECKVYVNYNVRVLKDTNLDAHEKLRQQPFYTGVLINKWADIFKEEWEEYSATSGQKSEKGFVLFLVNKGKRRAEALNMLTSSIINSVLEDKENKIGDFVAESNRAKATPLTINLLKQTIFKLFVSSPPLEIEIDKSDALREYERKNILTLLNTLVDETLINKWNPDRNDGEHKKSERIYSAGSMKAWVTMLRDIIAAVLRLYDEEGRNNIFLRQIDEQTWGIIKGRVKKLFANKIWTDPSSEIDVQLRVNNEKHVKGFFESHGLKVEKLIIGE